MTHPHSALQIFKFLSHVHDSSPTKELFDGILLSLRTPRFSPVTSIADRWLPVFASQLASLTADFQQLMTSASRSPDYDGLLIRVADHFPLIYRVSCYLENDLELELFVRCLCIDSATPVTKDEVKTTLLQFFRQLPEETREYVEEIVMDDGHGYLTRESNGCLDLDRVYRVLQDDRLFDEFMAVVQSHAVREVDWSETVREIYGLVAPRGLWDQIAPLIQQVYVETDNTQYDSYEQYVQMNFLSDGGKEYLDNEIDKAQMEHMFGKLSM